MTMHDAFAIANNRQAELEAEAAAHRLAREAKKARRTKKAEASGVQPRRWRLFARPRPA